MSTQPRAVIVGAGIAGLGSAIALQQAGWRVALLERGDRLRGDGTALLVQANAIRALRALGLGMAIEAMATPVNAGRYRRRDGRELVHIGTPESPEVSTVVVHREDLFEALVAALGSDVEVHTSTTATHIDLVRSAAGDRARRWPADLVVGADGIGSAVRSAIDQASRIRGTGTVAFRAVVPPHRAPELPDEGGETQGPDGHRFLYAPMGRRGVYWAAVMPGGLRPEPPDVRRDLLKRWFADWHDPIPRLIATTRAEEIHQQEIAYLKPLPQRYVHTGEGSGAVLVGDAAHAMTPDLGQGAGLALEDAVTLGVCMTNRSVEDGLAEYERLRRSRTVKLAKASQRLGAVLGARGRVGSSLRNGVLRALPDGWLGRGTDSAADWTPPSPR
ncbi:FAD-dependent oxidoreductase [Stackebrandtia soli]|uniref:FAD-dependent oxidoreductase n=1 Tax=Stackebrandtia soli TaxID=1892856 RepID=UPI0039EA126A